MSCEDTSEYVCPPAIRISRKIDINNTRAMRYSVLVRTGLGKAQIISNSGGNINKTYTEPVRNQF
jgi:hypothetical protein